MSQFNLIDEPWIPIRYPGGQRVELGIRETLLRAQDILAIEDGSPLVVLALHRLLLAVLYRALEGPKDIVEAKALFRAGISAERVAQYLARWHDRFWLFDEQHPFFQVASYEPPTKKGRQEWKTWACLAAEHNASNAKVLFDHVELARAGSIPSAAAARWLLACQTFSLGGGNSDFGYTTTAPSATAAMVIPLGATLHDTLVMSLVPENAAVFEGDTAVWETAPPSIVQLKEGRARDVSGIADLYTWRSRAIRIRHHGAGSTVSEVAFAAGTKPMEVLPLDPMLGYRIHETLGRRPLKLQDRGLWRDFDSLLPDGSGLSPRVVEHAASLTREYPRRAPRSLLVAGQVSDQAKIECWRMECFAFPVALSEDRSIRWEIRQLLLDAEKTEKALWRANLTYARAMLSHVNRELSDKDLDAKNKKTKRAADASFAAQLPATASYWSALERAFHTVLQDYADHREFDDVRRQWYGSIRSAMVSAWGRQRSALSAGDAWSIRAAVKAERHIRIGLSELDGKLASLQQTREAE